jgi:Ca-activated chloride channel family protein
MNVTHPWVLWATFALVAMITVWHLLRQRTPSRIVPSTWLWQQLLLEQRTSRPWDWPRPWWWWLLRVLIVLLMGLAAAGPYVPYTAIQAPQVVLAIDRSASMATRLGDSHRGARARQYAHAIIDSLDPDQRVTILAFDRDVTMLTNQQLDRAHTHMIIDTIEPRMVAGSMAALQSWVDLSADPTMQVIVLSDDAALFDAGIAGTGWQGVPVGGPALNHAIEGVRATQTAADWVITVRVAMDGADQPMSRRIEVRSETGALVEAQTLRLDPRAPVDWQFTLATPPALLVFSLTPDPLDDFGVDDTVVWQPAQAAPVRVMLQSADTTFLPAALAILPNVQMVGDRTQADIVMTDRIDMLERPLPQALWLMNPLEASTLITPTTAVALPRLSLDTVQLAAAELVRDINIAQTQILTASVFASTYWAQPWLSSAAGTHAVAGTVDGYPVVVTGFDLRASNLPLRVDYPLLIRNIISYLAPSTNQLTWATGQPVRLARTTDPLPRLVQQPAGAQATIEAVGDWYVLRHTDYVGAYRVDEQWYAVNLDAPHESAVSRPVVPVDIPLANGAVVWSLQTWLLSSALLLLLGERVLMWQMRRNT